MGIRFARGQATPPPKPPDLTPWAASGGMLTAKPPWACTRAPYLIKHTIVLPCQASEEEEGKVRAEWELRVMASTFNQLGQTHLGWTGPAQACLRSPLRQHRPADWVMKLGLLDQDQRRENKEGVFEPEVDFLPKMLLGAAESIDHERVEKMEAPLKEDTLKEAKHSKSALMVIHERNEKHISHAWEGVTPDVIQTPPEVFKSLEADRVPIQNARVPLTGGKAPKSSDIDTVANHIASAAKDTALVFNCKMGWRRTTTGTVIAYLVKLKIDYGRLIEILGNNVTHEASNGGSSSGNEAGGNIEISLLKVLINGISSFLHLSFSGNMNSEPVTKYYQKAEEMLKLLKPIIDVIVNSEFSSDEVLSKIFEELGHTVNELREHIENWDMLSSKAYFVMQAELLISRIRSSGLKIFQQLKASQQCSEHLEHCQQKLKHLGHEKTSSVIKEAITEQLEGVGPSLEVLAKIADSLGLKSNQEFLIEAVALEKLKENTEQTEKTTEAEYIDQMITVVTRMHERLVMLKQAQSCSPVIVPADFCCPLSLELMTDPIIVASGQTYERAFIKNWIDLGLTVCPKTRQTLSHINLIPNYTVKALIANWCESNNGKLVDPTKSTTLNQGTTRGSPVFAHSRSNQPPSPESARSRSFSSPGLDDRSASSDGSSVDSVGQPTMSPSRREASSAFSSETQTHARTVSDSALSSATFPQVTQGDDNSAPQQSTSQGYNREASGELNPGPDAGGATAMPSPHRETELPPRLLDTRSRSQALYVKLSLHSTLRTRLISWAGVLLGHQSGGPIAEEVETE